MNSKLPVNQSNQEVTQNQKIVTPPTSPVTRPVRSTPPSSSILKPLSDETTQLEKEGKPMKKVIILGVVVTLLLGVGTGYMLAVNGQGSGGIQSEPGLQREVTESEITVGTKVGVRDERTFKDMGEGMLQKGGIDGEGSHHLIRPGGESQTIYITSSVIDLDQFVGRKVKVWGETVGAQKAGWLMDVGKLEVLE